MPRRAAGSPPLCFSYTVHVSLKSPLVKCHHLNYSSTWDTGFQIWKSDVRPCACKCTWSRPHLGHNIYSALSSRLVSAYVWVPLSSEEGRVVKASLFAGHHFFLNIQDLGWGSKVKHAVGTVKVRLGCRRFNVFTERPHKHSNTPYYARMCACFPSFVKWETIYPAWPFP